MAAHRVEPVSDVSHSRYEMRIGATPAEPEWSILDAAILLYLALPTLLFLLGWLRLEAGVPLALLLLAGLRRSLTTRREPIPPLAAALAVITAVVWAALGGAGHLVFANFDWQIRDAVLFDLTALSWPVVYDGPLLLRSAIGYFLPAAGLAKLIGPGWADPVLLLWTMLGAALLLLAVAARTRTPGRTALGLAAFCLFSGADILGMLIADKPLSLTSHLEWWAGAVQYSAHTTQLLWVPNHALGAWLATVLIWRHGGRPTLLPVLGLLLALLPLWSPLSAAGVIPLAALALLAGLRAGHGRHSLSLANLLAAPAVGGVVAAYATIAAGTVRHVPVWADLTGAALALVIGTFLLLEAVPVIGALWLAQGRLRLDQGVAAALLLTLPFYNVGPSSDLSMRASIPALALLALSIVDVVATLPRSRLGRALPLIAILLVGAATPLTEIARALSEPRWPPAGMGLTRVADPAAITHYLADPTGSPVAPLLGKLGEADPGATRSAP